MNYLAKRRVRIRSAYRRAEDGKVTASGERIQSPAHAPEPHAVHAARRAPRCRTHRHPVTGQSTASPAGAGTGSCRAGPQGQPEYDQHGSPREVSPFFSLSPLHTHTRIDPHTYTRIHVHTNLPLPFTVHLAIVALSGDTANARSLSRCETIFRKLRVLAAGNIFINFLPVLYELAGGQVAPDEMVMETRGER